jgi:hypothetical protein
MTNEGLRQLGSDIFVAKSMFSVGGGCCGDLTASCLQERLKEAVTMHPDALQLPNESTPEQLAEERQMVDRLFAGEDIPLRLDCTMTIVKFENEKLMVHSPCPLTDELKQQINLLGTVVSIVAPNLQHWLNVQEYFKEWPGASIYVAPADPAGEDLQKKLAGLPTQVLQDGVCQIHSSIQQRLLHGAALYMNEFVFYHEPSQTIIAADSYYGGYTQLEQPDWFGRIWFKCTKGSFMKPRLPIYRTARVLSHGDIDSLLASLQNPTLLGCPGGMLHEWSQKGIRAIIYAHGTDFWPARPVQQFLDGWSEVLEMRSRETAKATDKQGEMVQNQAERPPHARQTRTQTPRSVIC